MRLESLETYITKSVEHDGGPVIFDEEWATRESVREAMIANREECLDTAARWRGHAREHQEEPERRADCLTYTARYRATAEKYTAAIAALEEDQ